jgi:predicted dehydrogenase
LVEVERFPGPVLVRGTGSAGQRHLRILRDDLCAETVAFPVRSSRTSELEAAGFRTTTDPRGLVPRPFGAIVASSTARHVSDAIGLLPLCDVLIEKPLAPSVHGLAELRQAAADGGRRAFVAFCLRFNGGLRRFAKAIPSLGQVDSVRVECQSFLPDWRPDSDYKNSYSADPDEGGVLRDLTHELDYATWLFGRPSHVFCVLGGSSRLGIGAEAAADLLWSVPDGPTVSLRLDYLTRQRRRRVVATGSGGVLTWDAVAGTVVLEPVAGEPVAETVVEDYDEMYRRQGAAFLRACAGESPGALAGLEEGIFVTSLADAARRSAGSGRLEPIAAVETA